MSKHGFKHHKPPAIIIKNMARCKKCEDIIESLDRHDFKQCRCGEIFIDGGKNYIRQGWKDINNIESMSLYSDEPEAMLKANIYEARLLLSKTLPDDSLGRKNMEEYLERLERELEMRLALR